MHFTIINNTLIGRGRRALRALTAGAILTVGVITAGGGLAHAGSIVPPQYDPTCGPGSISQYMPKVLANTVQRAWEYTEVDYWNGSQWVMYQQTGWRYRTVSPYLSRDYGWVDYQQSLISVDRFFVPTGFAYRMQQAVLVDGQVLNLVSNWCYA